MKKKMLAIAVASAVSAPVFAQNVSIYGIFDAGYQSSKADVLRYTSSTASWSVDKLETSGVVGNGVESTSRLGFRGTEDLGGGLKAHFLFETGINGATSTITPWNNRQALVGLEGGFGRVDVGTLYSPLHGIAAAFNPNTLPNLTGDVMYVQGDSVTSISLSSVGMLGADSTATTTDLVASVQAKITAAEVLNVSIAGGTATGTVVASTLNTINNIIKNGNTTVLNRRLALANTTSYTVRNNNTVGYTSPSFNGITAQVQMTGENTVKTVGRAETTTSGNNAAVRYASGKLAASVGYATSKAKSYNLQATSATRVDGIVRSWSNAGSDATNAYAAGIIETATTVFPNAEATVEAKNRETMAAVSYDLGMVKLNYIYTQRETKDTTSDLSDKTTHSVGLKAPVGATTLFLNYSTGDMKVLPGTTSEAKFDLKGAQVGASYALSKRTDAYAMYGRSELDRNSSANDIKNKQYAIGVRHQF